MQVATYSRIARCDQCIRGDRTGIGNSVSRRLTHYLQVATYSRITFQSGITFNNKVIVQLGIARNGMAIIVRYDAIRAGRNSDCTGTCATNHGTGCTIGIDIRRTRNIVGRTGNGIPTCICLDGRCSGLDCYHPSRRTGTAYRGTERVSKTGIDIRRAGYCIRSLDRIVRCTVCLADDVL